MSALYNQEEYLSVEKIYPNPSQGIIMFDTDIFIPNIPIIARVYDMLGNICEEILLEEKRSLDISHLNSGIYLLKLQQKEKIITNRIIMTII